MCFRGREIYGGSRTPLPLHVFLISPMSSSKQVHKSSMKPALFSLDNGLWPERRDPDVENISRYQQAAWMSYVPAGGQEASHVLSFTVKHCASHIFPGLES